MLRNHRPQLARRPGMTFSSSVGHRNYGEWKYRQKTALADLNRQDYTLNMDGEDLESFPLS